MWGSTRKTRLAKAAKQTSLLTATAMTAAEPFVHKITKRCKSKEEQNRLLYSVRWLLESYFPPGQRICIFIAMFRWSGWFTSFWVDNVHTSVFLSMLHSLPLHCVQFVLLECPTCGEHTLHWLDWTDSSHHFIPPLIFIYSTTPRCSTFVQLVCVIEHS